jgi:hypothetical protein
MDECQLARRARVLAFGAVFVAATAAFGSARPAAAAFQFHKIVDNTTLIPNGGGAHFEVRGAPAVGDGWVAFENNDLTIWRATTTGTQIGKVITTATVIPDGFGTFKQYFPNYMQVNGSTLVLVGDSCGGCGAGVGIFATPILGGPVTKLVDTNNTSASFPGADKHFGGFPPDFRIGDGTVVFQNRQQAFAVPLAGGKVTAVAGIQDQNVSPPAPYCCNFSEPSVKGTKVFIRGGNVNGRNALQTVNKSGAKTSFRFAVTNATHPPGTPTAYRFDDFEFFSPVIDQALVFGGGSAAPSKPYVFGVYAKGTKLVRLADSTQAVPGGTGKFYPRDWFGHAAPIVASNGVVVFGARDSVTDDYGLYAVRETGGPVQKIIAAGDPIGGFTVAQAGVDIGKAALSGSTLAFLVGYVNSAGAGIYSTQVVLP